MSVQLDLLHGGHVQNLDTFNQILDIHRYRPSRAVWGQAKFFAAVISKVSGNVREMHFKKGLSLAEDGFKSWFLDGFCMVLNCFFFSRSNC